MTTLIYSPTGTVHMRNLELLARALPDVRFRVLYRPAQEWVDREVVRNYPYEAYFETGGRPPGDLFAGQVDGILLCLAAMDGMVARLIEEGLARGIPVLTVQEVLQSALNQGAVNHYLMPVDKLLVGSEYEQQALHDLGIDPDRVQVTGWPFYSGLKQRASTERRRELRERWNVPVDQRVATLCLSAIRRETDLSSQETPRVRREMLHLVREGLPDGCGLVVKLHPTDASAGIRNGVQQMVPDAVVLAGETGIDDALDMSDVCLNRGNSQVCIEAMLRDMPLVVIPLGIRTIFHDSLPHAIANSPEQLRRIVEALNEKQASDYAALFRQHLPLSPERALQETATAIRDGLAAGPGSGRQWMWVDLALFWGATGNVVEAGRCIRGAERTRRVPDSLLRPLRRVVLQQAGLQDVLALRGALTHAYRQPLILSAWVHQLYQRRGKSPTAEELAVVDPEWLPSPLNPHCFVVADAMLGHLHLQAGNEGDWRRMVEHLEEEGYGDLPFVQRLAARDWPLGKPHRWQSLRRLGRQGLNWAHRLPARVGQVAGVRPKLFQR